MITLLERLKAIHFSPIPPRAPKKGFKPSVEGVPMLEDYGVAPGEEFWKKFPVNRNLRGGTPFKLNVSEIRSLSEAAELSGPDMELVERVVGDILHGADLMVGEQYVPTRNRNASSAVRDGLWVTDAVAKGVVDKIYAGPFKTCPRTATVNSLQTAPKPNGKVRLILNQSAPKGKGVNQSIHKDEYPVRMGGMKHILYALNHSGVGALFFKCDWQSAYKHIHVKQKQLKYQWFNWLGMFFCELCLIFGNISSVGLYDRLARLMVTIAVQLAEFPPILAVQHLDDLCGISPKDGVAIWRFY